MRFFLQLLLTVGFLTRDAGAGIAFTDGGAISLEEELVENLAKIGKWKSYRESEKSQGGQEASLPQQPSSVQHFVRNIPEEPEIFDDNRPPPPPGFGVNEKPPQPEELKIDKTSGAVDQLAPISASQLKSPLVVESTEAKRSGQPEEPFPPPPLHQSRAAAYESKRAESNGKSPDDVGDTIFIAVSAVCTTAAVFGVVIAIVTMTRLHKQYKAAQESEYPQYGVTGPREKGGSGQHSPVAAADAKLATSAQVYHFQHTKEKILAMEQSTTEGKGQESDESDNEGDEGDFSVYECPGLAPTGDIEISNPLFENGVPSPPAAKQDKKDPA